MFGRFVVAGFELWSGRRDSNHPPSITYRYSHQPKLIPIKQPHIPQLQMRNHQ